MHLRNSHGYLHQHIKHVFDPTNDDAMFKCFGPYTEEEAHDLGLRVRPFGKIAQPFSSSRAEGPTEEEVRGKGTTWRDDLLAAVYSAPTHPDHYRLANRDEL